MANEMNVGIKVTADADQAKKDLTAVGTVAQDAGQKTAKASKDANSTAKKETAAATTQTKKDIKSVGDQAAKTGNTVTNTIKSAYKSIFNLKNAVAGLITGYGINKFTQSFIDAGREIEQLEIKMSRIGDPKSGEKIYRQLNQIAIETGTTASKLANAWITMANSGVQLSEDAMRSMADVGNVLGEDVYGLISEQLLLIAQHGEISTRQLDSFARAGIDARAILEEAFGLPVDKLKANGIEAGAIIDKLTSGMGASFKDAANDVGQSWDGTMALLAAKWDGFKLTVADSGAFDMLKAGLQTINTLADKVFATDNPEKWAQIISAIAEKGVPLLYNGLTMAARGVLTLVQGFQSLAYIWKSVETAYNEGQAVAAKAHAEHVQKQIDALQDQLDKLDDFSPKYQQIFRDIEDWEQKLNKATAAQAQYTDKAAESQEQVNNLAKSIEAMDDELERLKDLSTEGAKALEVRLQQIKYLSGITSDEVARLHNEADAASVKAAALFQEIAALTAQGLKAPADLLANYTRALNEASIATLKHMQALAAYTSKGGQNKEGLGAETTVKSTLAGAGGGIDTAKQMALAQAKATADMLKMVSQAEITGLNNLLEDGLISVTDYYDRRRAELKTQYDADLALLDTQLGLTKDKVERFNLEQEKTKLTFSFEMADADLQRESMQREAALALEKAALLRDIELRVMEDTLENRMTLRLESLGQQHEAEIEALREKQATEEEIIQASLNQQLEMEKTKVEESRRIFESQMAGYQTIAGNISTIFNEMYEATGESNKAFFLISKAAAIAEAMINTQVAVTKALAAGGPFMGPALAAVAAASGAAAVATIVAQSLATGGLVQGHSPHKRADNIPASLTAGEFVQQVDAVNYYGLDVMKALNARAIPKDVLKSLMGGISLPAFTPRGRKLAYGGVAANDSTPAPADGSKTILELTIVNVQGEDSMGEYLMSSDGQMRIVNVIGNNKEPVRQQLELG